MIQTDNVQHPKNGIILMDGRVLECYPIEEGTGEVKEEAFMEIQKRLFISNVFYLYAHRERILTDSRLFLCPVEFNNGMIWADLKAF